MRAWTSEIVGFLVTDTPSEIVANVVISCMMNLFNYSISTFILIFDNIRLSIYPSINSLLDLHKPIFVSCLASPRSTKCRVKSSVIMSLILPPLFSLAISIVKANISGSCPNIDKFFYFFSQYKSRTNCNNYSILGRGAFISVFSSFPNFLPTRNQFLLPWKPSQVTLW